MNQKIFLDDLAELLHKRSHISDNDAKNFVTCFFDTIREQLFRDGMVKIKGFGIFKLLMVEGRDSIDVNSGQRIYIDAHTRITFTPEPVLKDAVNKPFAEFSTVALNNEVETDAMEREEQLNDESQDDVEPQDLQSEADEIPMAIVEPVTEKPIQKKTHKIWWMLGYLLSVLIAFALGAVTKNTIAVPVWSWMVEIVEGGSAQSNNQKENITFNEVKKVKKDTIVAATVPVDSSQYYPQIEGGEYLIVGVIKEEVMRPGKTLMQFSRKYYGSKDFVDYIIIMNKIDNPDVISLNAKIIIPKLQKKEN